MPAPPATPRQQKRHDIPPPQEFGQEHGAGQTRSLQCPAALSRPRPAEPVGRRACPSSSSHGRPRQGATQRQQTPLTRRTRVAKTSQANQASTTSLGVPQTRPAMRSPAHEGNIAGAHTSGACASAGHCCWPRSPGHRTATERQRPQLPRHGPAEVKKHRGGPLPSRDEMRGADDRALQCVREGTSQWQGWWGSDSVAVWFREYVVFARTLEAFARMIQVTSWPRVRAFAACDAFDPM